MSANDRAILIFVEGKLIGFAYDEGGVNDVLRDKYGDSSEWSVPYVTVALPEDAVFEDSFSPQG